jgi:hypothetical protein
MSHKVEAVLDNPGKVLREDETMRGRHGEV